MPNVETDCVEIAPFQYVWLEATRQQDIEFIREAVQFYRKWKALQVEMENLHEDLATIAELEAANA